MTKYLALLLLLLLSPQSRSQDSSAQQDLQFVQRLRSEGYKNLAEDYLQRLDKVGPPEIKAELPLEMAVTRLERAQEEPDSGKRTAGYRKAAADIRAFLTSNPNHPRADEARLYIARVSVLQGRSQLSRALADPAAARIVTPALREARHTFEAAGEEIKQVVNDIGRKLVPLKNQQPTTPAEKAVKSRLEQNALKGTYDQGLNSYYQALTYPRFAQDSSVIIDRGERIDQAIEHFNALARADVHDPIYWTAKAWGARCLADRGKPKDARQKYEDIRKVADKEPAAAEANRLVRYFDLLTVQENPDLINPKGAALRYLDREARDWLVRYPRFLKTPEGYGIRYLLAELVLEKTENPRADDLNLGAI